MGLTTQEIQQNVSNDDTWQCPCLLSLTGICLERKNNCSVLLPGVSLTEYPQISETLTKRPRPLLAGKQRPGHCLEGTDSALSICSLSPRGSRVLAACRGPRSQSAGRPRLALSHEGASSPRAGASSPRAGALSPRGRALFLRARSLRAGALSPQCVLSK